MPKSKRSKPWPVQDVRYVEVALTELTTRHLHVEFDHGIRIVVANKDQLPLAARLIEQLRQEVRSNNTAAKGGLS